MPTFCYLAETLETQFQAMTRCLIAPMWVLRLSLRARKNFLASYL